MAIEPKSVGAKKFAQRMREEKPDLDWLNNWFNEKLDDLYHDDVYVAWRDEYEAEHPESVEKNEDWENTKKAKKSFEKYEQDNTRAYIDEVKMATLFVEDIGFSKDEIESIPPNELEAIYHTLVNYLLKK
ncbi:hypothetical protein FACS1894188_07060 [Clostridia bacterium]|nr:hypothetical protein FACS1894188_07060 [Clostridia bacterium]